MTGPTGHIVGRVGIRVLPNTTDFLPALKRYLQRVKDTISVEIPTRLDMKGATKDLEELRARLANTQAVIGARLDTAEARAQLELLRRSIGAASGDVKVNVDKSRFISAIGSLIPSLSRLKSAALITLKVGGLATIAPVLAAGVVQAIALASALGSAAGAAALIPAALAGIAAVGGALGLGLSGLAANLKPAAGGGGGGSSGSGDQAAKDAQAQVDAQRNLAASQRNLATAYRNASASRIQDAQKVTAAEQSLKDAELDEVRTQQDLVRARAEAAQQIADLRVQLSGAVVDQEAAAVDLAQAKENLQAVLANDFSTATEKAAAKLAVDQATQKVADTAQQYKDLKKQSDQANKDGVGGAKNVVQAQDAVHAAVQKTAQAQQDLTNAQRDQKNDAIDSANSILDAQDGLAQAQERTAAATAAVGAAAGGAGQALTRLSPAGNALVAVLKSLAPAWTNLRLDVQQALLQGVAGDVLALAQGGLPVLRAGLVGVATQLNAGIRSLLQWGSQASTLKGIGEIFHGIQGFLAQLVPAVKPAAQALLDLTRVGAGFGPQVGNAIAGVIEKASAALSNAAKDGSLQKMLGGALAILKDLGAILVNSGTFLANFLGAGVGPGTQLLDNLTQITKTVADFSKSAQGKSAFAAIFGGASQLLSSLTPTLAPLVGLAGTLVTALGPVVQLLGPALAQAVQILVPAVSSVVKVLGPVLGKTLAALLPVLAKALAALGPGISTMLAALGPALVALGPAVLAIGQALGQGLVAIAPIMKPLAGAISAVVVALAPLIPVIASMIGTILPPLASLFTQVVQAVAPLISQLAGPSGLSGIFPAIAQVVTALTGVLVPFIKQLVVQLKPEIPVISAQLIALFKALLPLAPIIGQVLTALLPFIPNLVKIALVVTSLAIQLLPALVKVLAFIAPALLAPISVAVAVSSAFAKVAGSVQGVIDKFDGFLSNVAALPEKIKGLALRFAEAGKSIMDGILDGLRVGLSSAVGFAENVASDIWDAVKGFINRNFIDPFKHFSFTIKIAGVGKTFQPFGGLPELALGATVLPRDGGTLAVLAEAGKPETVTDTGQTNKLIALTNALAAKAISTPTQAGGHTVNIYTQPGTDPTLIARDVTRQLAFQVG